MRTHNYSQRALSTVIHDKIQRSLMCKMPELFTLPIA